MRSMPPPYVPAADLALKEIEHSWDDWDPYPLIQPADVDVQERLGQVSDFGKLTFALGCAEWVLWRLAPHFQDDRPWQFVDACWAFELSEQYALPAELEDSEWTGPILGPMCLSLTTVLNTRYGFDESNAEVDAAFAHQVVLHVLPGPALFTAWTTEVLDRLVRLSSDGEPERMPREVLNPRVALPGAAERGVLRRESVQALDLRDNPYARSLT